MKWYDHITYRIIQADLWISDHIPGIIAVGLVVVIGLIAVQYFYWN